MQRTAKQTDQSKLKAEAPVDGRRRYKKGHFPAYDQEYHRLGSRSIIFNAAGKKDLKNAFAGTGIGECQRSLIELVGNGEGKYKEGTYWYTALIPAATSNLEEVHADFKRWQSQQVRSGQSLDPPTEWPEEMLQERLKGEARLDVRRREKVYLEARIEKLKEKQGKLPPEVQMLPDGPVTCSVKSGKERLKSIDGQNVSYSLQGRPYIDQPNSPYHLMPLANYFDMAKAWKSKHRIHDMDLVKRAKEYKEKLKVQDLKPPAMFARRKFTSLIKGEVKFKGQAEWPDFEPWPDNPDWPKDAKKITEIENETEDS